MNSLIMETAAVPFRPPQDLDARVRLIPQHVVPLPIEAEVPRLHYERSANDFWNLLLYFERNLEKVKTYRAPFERHFGRLRSMVLLGLVEAFERFLKEMAAACIDHVGDLVLDDRLKVFDIKGNVLAAHFAGGSLGKSTCEPLTWVDCKEVNDRFRKILANPFQDGNFYVFPQQPGQQPAALAGRFELVSLIWQLRHTIVHNAGVITTSDAMKFTRLTRQKVEGPRVLWPRRGDVWYVKLFLDETVEKINEEISRRLAELLTILHGSDPNLFQPDDRAQNLANLFRLPVQVAGVTRNPV
jgi:hypothetical protein